MLSQLYQMVFGYFGGKSKDFETIETWGQIPVS